MNGVNWSIQTCGDNILRSQTSPVSEILLLDGSPPSLVQFLSGSLPVPLSGLLLTQYYLLSVVVLCPRNYKLQTITLHVQKYQSFFSFFTRNPHRSLLRGFLA